MYQMRWSLLRHFMICSLLRQAMSHDMEQTLRARTATRAISCLKTFAEEEEALEAFELLEKTEPVSSWSASLVSLTSIWFGYSPSGVTYSSDDTEPFAIDSIIVFEKTLSFTYPEKKKRREESRLRAFGWERDESFDFYWKWADFLVQIERCCLVL